MTEETRLRRLSELYRELAELGDVADKDAHLELSMRFLKQADDIHHRQLGSNGGTSH